MDEWFYTRAGQQKGPVSWDELRQMAGSGLLKPTDMVWKDGMADWIAAEKREGLFARSRPAKAPAEEEDRPRRRPREDEDDDRPRRRSEEAEDDDRPRRRRDADEDEDDDRPRRRRRRASEGMSTGAKVAIIGGSVFVGLIVIVVIIVLVVRGGGGGGGPGQFTVNLLPRQQHWRMIRFNANQNVTITVTSTITIPDTDVDLFVERANGMPLAADVALTKDCRVNFVAPASESYKVSVRNLGPGHATCVVNIN